MTAHNLASFRGIIKRFFYIYTLVISCAFIKFTPLFGTFSMKSLLLKRLLPVLALVIATSAIVLAQPNNGGPGPDPDPTTTPIDGGVSLLLAGGVAYGIKRLRARRKKA